MEPDPIPTDNRPEWLRALMEKSWNLELIISELGVSIYSLDKQKGGIPGIFFDKQREAERNGKSIRPPSDDSEGHDDTDDGEVIEIFEPRSKKVKHSCFPLQKTIIEIL